MQRYFSRLLVASALADLSTWASQSSGNSGDITGNTLSPIYIQSAAKLPAGHVSDRETIDIPEEMQEWVQDTFGDAAKSRSEAYRLALWYARYQYERSTDDD